MRDLDDTRLSTSELVALACLLEVIASKPGNVHRGADFADLTFGDFAVSAILTAPLMERVGELGVGATVLAAVQRTRHFVGRNTNLGMILLLTPLVAVPREQPLRPGIGRVLDTLTAADAAAVYEAIRSAQPGGMGEVDQFDVHRDSPPPDLRTAMSLAAGRDAIARQYVTDFATVFEIAGQLADGARRWSLLDALIQVHVATMAREPDSLILRKAGPEEAERSRRIAAVVRDAGPPDSDAFWSALSDLDFWLRSAGKRRNPGTTADLICAGLFVALRENLVTPPFR